MQLWPWSVTVGLALTNSLIRAVAAGHSVDVGRWDAESDRLLDRMAARFARVETRRRVAGSCSGCWPICRGRTVGRSPSTPVTAIRTACSTCSRRASWDTDGVRDDLRDYVVGAARRHRRGAGVRRDRRPEEGRATVGVQRQYTGTAGRIENAQVAVYLTYAAARGHALIDRELYLPAVLDRRPAAAEPRPGFPTTSSS